MEEAKGKGGACGGGTGTAGPSPMQVAVMSLKESKFPDNGESGSTRGDDLAWDHYSVPKVFTPEVKFVVGLPQENLQKWFGERTWAGLLTLCVKTRGNPDDGRWTIRCPVLACNRHWLANSHEEAERMIVSFSDHLCQKAMKEYANGYFGSEMVYPPPWWWFQINAFMIAEQLGQAKN
jgi:hypothetical protein